MSAFCSGCGKPLAPGDILYTADARIVCAVCNGVTEVAQANWNAGNKIRNAAIASLVCGLGGWLIDPVFLVTIATVALAIYALTSVNKGTDEQFQIAKDRGMIYGCSIFGLVMVALKIVVIYLIVTH